MRARCASNSPTVHTRYFANIYATIRQLTLSRVLPHSRTLHNTPRRYILRRALLGFAHTPQYFSFTVAPPSLISLSVSLSPPRTSLHHRRTTIGTQHKTNELFADIQPQSNTRQALIRAYFKQVMVTMRGEKKFKKKKFPNRNCART